MVGRIDKAGRIVMTGRILMVGRIVTGRIDKAERIVMAGRKEIVGRTALAGTSVVLDMLALSQYLLYFQVPLHQHHGHFSVFSHFAAYMAAPRVVYTLLLLPMVESYLELFPMAGYFLQFQPIHVRSWLVLPKN